MTDTKTMTWLPMSEAPRDKRIVAWHIDGEWLVLDPNEGCVSCRAIYPWRNAATGEVYYADELTHFFVVGAPLD